MGVENERNIRNIRNAKREEESKKEIDEVKAIIKLLKEKDILIRDKCDFLQTLIDSMPNPVYTKDKNCRYKLCNKAFMNNIGLTEENIIGKSIIEIYPTNETAKELYEKDLNLIMFGGVETFEINLHSKILFLNRTVYRNKNGEIEGIIGTCFDITDRVKKEKQLKISQEKFYRAFDSSPIPKIITEYGTGIITEINESCLTFFGFTYDEVINKVVYNLKTNDGKPLIKEHEKFNMEFFLSKLDYYSKISNMEIEMYIRNGEEKLIQISASKYANNGGFCILTILKDVTDRKMAEDKLKQLQYNYENFFNTINEFLFVLDMKGIILHVNDKVVKQLGYLRKELIDQSILLLYSEECKEKVNNFIYEMLDGKSELRTIPVITKSGIQIPVETRMTRGFWDGNPVIFGVSKDVSDLKLSEEMFSKLFYINPRASSLNFK